MLCCIIGYMTPSSHHRANLFRSCSLSLSGICVATAFIFFRVIKVACFPDIFWELKVVNSLEKILAKKSWRTARFELWSLEEENITEYSSTELAVYILFCMSSGANLYVCFHLWLEIWIATPDFKDHKFQIYNKIKLF